MRKPRHWVFQGERQSLAGAARDRRTGVVLQLPQPPVLATYLTMASIATAILIYDRRTIGKISKASMIGAAVVFGQQLLHIPIARSEPFADFVSFLGSLVYYR